MKNPRLHRCAVLFALSVLLLIATGASLTSVIRPLPGTPPADAATAPPEIAAELERAHGILAGLVAVLAFALALAAPIGLRLPAWTAAGLVVADGALGIHRAAGTLPPVAGVFHALLAPALFSTAVAIAVFTSKSWLAPPVPA